MSLSTLLLSSKAQIDTELDNLFTIQVPKAAPSRVDSRRSKETTRHKRKHQSTGNSSLEDIPKKRLKSDLEDKSTSIPDGETLPEQARKKKIPSRGNDLKKQKGKDVNLDIENARAPTSAPTSVSDDECEDSEHDEENGRPTLLHESLANDPKKRTKQKTRKHVPEDETSEMRDRRTIFVGNLPLDVLSKKPLKKQLQRHILSFVTTARIESIRFRSIPFQVPTSKLPTSDDEESQINPNKTEARTHSVDRASLWRAHHEDKDEASLKVDEKKYLTPSQKKKIAYINQEFHSTADTVNAYIVFAHPVDPEARPDNLPPLPATMDPYQAALQVAQKADGSLFMERMIRVDLAKRAKAGASSLDDTSTVSVPPNRETDSQLSIFVGNLEFGSREEDLRVFFEGLMCTERGPPLEGETPDGEDDGDGTATEKPLTWVTRVRIIRDKDTQLGKGFAYLQFADRECVDEVLAMEESKLKFAKRKLRVQRCKRIPEGLKHGVAHSTATKSHAKSKQPSSRSTGNIVVPKGDPSLGIKLAGLSKEERKKLKSMDSDRKTRRLAKKKARMSMASNVAKDRKRVRSKMKKG